jgi:hypothetical protein
VGRHVACMGRGKMHVKFWLSAEERDEQGDLGQY